MIQGAAAKSGRRRADQPGHDRRGRSGPTNGEQQRAADQRAERPRARAVRRSRSRCLGGSAGRWRRPRGSSARRRPSSRRWRCSAGTPIASSVGKVMKVPPPATPLATPPSDPGHEVDHRQAPPAGSGRGEHRHYSTNVNPARAGPVDMPDGARFASSTVGGVYLLTEELIVPRDAPIDLIRAAGGDRAPASCPAAASRSRASTARARGDWTFPKGKLDPGENFEQAARARGARRDGLRCAIERFIGTTNYTHRKGRPKIVAYYLMSRRATARSRPTRRSTTWCGSASSSVRAHLTWERDRELFDLARSRCPSCYARGELADPL